MKFTIGIEPGDIVRFKDRREGVVERVTGKTAWVTIVDDSRTYQIMCSKRSLRKIRMITIKIREIRESIQKAKQIIGV